MNKNVYFALGLVGGALAAVLTTRTYFRNKYEAMAQEEIDSVKGAYAKMTEKYKKKFEEKLELIAETEVNSVYGKQPAVPLEKPDLAEYTAKLDELRVPYISSSSDEPPASSEDDYLEIVSPDEYGENEDYEYISFTFYSDGVLTDDNENQMDDETIENTVGIHAVEHFGEYEDDVVYVRNDRLKVYYEICRDERTYAEVLEERPYLGED